MYCKVKGDTYRYAVVISGKDKGESAGEVKNASKSAYPNNNYSGNYWYIYKGLADPD